MSDPQTAGFGGGGVQPHSRGRGGRAPLPIDQQRKGAAQKGSTWNLQEGASVRGSE